MKKLYYSTCSFATPHIGVIINAIQNDIKEGHEVYFSYCSGVSHSCFKNMNANMAKCKLCKITYEKCIFDKLKGVKKIIPLNKTSHIPSQKPDYSSIAELKSLKYKNVYVGLSVLSLYFSITRNIEFEITSRLKKYFDDVIYDTMNLVDSANTIIEFIQPDCITIYNGRYYENRAFYDLALYNKLKFESLEVIGGFKEPFYPVKFTDCLPHDYHYFAFNAMKIWKMSKLSDEQKVKEASLFYQKRRHGIVACDKVYITNQKEGLLPRLFEGKKNIVIFNSSSDEIAAVGGEWDSEQLFNSQYECVKYIIDVMPENCHIYLRIHPNLEGVNHRHHLDLYKLSDYSNKITIIPPTDEISSYALLDIADKVIVFGSTMGAEACFWDKPVILIGPSFYADLNLAYRPMCIDEIKDLLEKDLLPKDKINSLYYSFYVQNRTERSEKINFDLTATERCFMWKKYRTYSYHKLFGSEILYKTIEVFYRVLMKGIYKDKNKMVF